MTLENLSRRRPVPRVLTARFMHETNTFSRVPTDMAMFRRRDFHLENEIPVAFRGTRSAFGATFEAADKFGWTLVHPVSANPNPSGTVTDDAFEQVTRMIFDAVDAKGPIDGALLHLHGVIGQRQPRGCRGRIPGASPQPARRRGACRRHPRSACECDAAHGRQCERADRL